MGNTVVLKPASYTRLTALLFAEICAEAGLPPGKYHVAVTIHDNHRVDLKTYNTVLRAPQFERVGDFVLVAPDPVHVIVAIQLYACTCIYCTCIYY